MTIGSVKDKGGYSHTVQWDEYSHDVYVDNGYRYVGKAYSAREAMTKAEAYLYDKSYSA